MRANAKSSALGWGGAALATAIGLMIAVGCGSSFPPAEEEEIPKPVAPKGQNTIAGDGDAGTDVPPGCGQQADGTSCGCVDVPLYDSPPTIYFVLDRSGSMATDDKWDQVRTTVANIMRSLGPRANFGATVFPGDSATDQCAAGVEVLPVTNGDPPSSKNNGPATSKLIAATSYLPGGGTPTAATLQAVHQRLLTVSGKIFVIVATDGAPNCNLDLTCNADQCQINIESAEGCTPGGENCCVGDNGPGNCNDSDATVAAITSLNAAGFSTYVVGLPGTSEYGSLLDAMAVAGGNALPTEPKYFAVNSASADVMLQTLRKIAAQITGTCVFTLKDPPKDPSLVNVYLDDVVLPFEPTNGWTLSGKTVTLVGSSCQNVTDGNVLDVRIITGCPTVLPK